MIESKATQAEFMPAEKLPLHDLILLPMLSLLTVAALLFGAEGVAHHFFVAVHDNSCSVDDAKVGFHYRPNCTTHAKPAEGTWVAHHFNDCGYRTRESCGPKPTQTTRIALLGASIAEGHLVAYDETFAARTAKQLTAQLGRPVEIQNLGREECYPICAYRRMEDALALKPDLVLIALSPTDLERFDPSDLADRDRPMPATVDQAQLRHKMDSHPILNAIQDYIGHSDAGVAALHYLFQNPATYVRMFLFSSERAAYIRTSMSPTWNKRMDAYDFLLGEMAKQARADGVPMVLVEVPSMAQVSLLSMSDAPAGLNAEALNDRLKQIAQHNGVQFIDGLDAYPQGSEANKLFYVVDGHLNGAGSELIANTLTQQLMQQQRAALSGQGR